MQIHAHKALRVFSSVVFASAVVLGPCVGVCSFDGLSAATMPKRASSHKGREGHCQKHRGRHNTTDCPNCQQNVFQIPEVKEAGHKTLLVPSYKRLAALPVSFAPLAATAPQAVFQPLDWVDALPPPLSVYCLHCSYLE